MDERTIKRLLVIVGVSLIAIFVFKSMMSRTIVNMNRVAVEKKQVAAALRVQQQSDAAPADAAISNEIPAVTGEVYLPESSAASAVNEVR